MSAGHGYRVFTVHSYPWRLEVVPKYDSECHPWEMEKFQIITYHVAFKLNFETWR